MSVNVRMLKEYLQHDLNILISGFAGTGKTVMLQTAVEELGYTMKYYSAPTIEPFTDLVGIPVPNNDTETIKFYRPHDIDKAEVIFMDELNRADDRTLNAFFEFLQFRSINGEPLPKLKCVIAAINPNDGNYTVNDLDIALLDRFDIYLQTNPTIDIPYFTSLFGSSVAKAVKVWWDDTHSNYTKAIKNSRNDAVYISPRRMEKVVSTYLKIPTISTIRNTMPPGAVCDFKGLKNAIDTALYSDDPVKAADSLANGEVITPHGTKVKVKDNTIAMLVGLDYAQLRSNKNRVIAEKCINSNSIEDSDKNVLLDSLSHALNKNVGAPNLASKWGFAVLQLSPKQMRTLTNGWSNVKVRQLNNSMYDIMNP